MGQDYGRGRALIAPSLEKWMAEKLQMEAAVLKLRRKAREERALVRVEGETPPAADPNRGRGGRRGGGRK